MNLRAIAQRDSRRILNGDAGIAMTITDPAGNAGTLTGWSNDIGFTIDPETGQAVSGRYVTIAISMIDLGAEGLGIPTGSEIPWQVSLTNEAGESFLFAVMAAQPDRTLGVVTCNLEALEV